MSGMTEALRHRFIVQAQREQGLSLSEAELIADFCAGLGDEMLRTISPILNRYREQITTTVRQDVIDELIRDFAAGGPYMNRKAFLSKLQIMKMPPPVVPVQRPRPNLVPVPTPLEDEWTAN